MEIIFLGTGSATPTYERNLAALAMRRERETLLFDCGESTQHQIIRSSLRRSRIKRIFITHLHGDHFYGLIGLLTSFQLNKREDPLELYGPPGLLEYIRFMKRISETDFAYQLVVRELRVDREPEQILDSEEYTIEAVRVRHRIYTMAYALIEKDRPGRFDAELAAGLSIPEGPERRLLKEGQDLTLDDGRIVRSADLVSPPTPGRKVSYVTDTTYTPASVKLAAGSDILIHESTYDDEGQQHARRTQHSTVGDAVRVAREAEAKLLVLTHISSRYLNQSGLLQEQVNRQLPGTLLASDMMRIELPPTGSPEVTWRQKRSRGVNGQAEKSEQQQRAGENG